MAVSNVFIQKIKDKLDQILEIIITDPDSRNLIRTTILAASGSLSILDLSELMDEEVKNDFHNTIKNGKDPQEILSTLFAKFETSKVEISMKLAFKRVIEEYTASTNHRPLNDAERAKVNEILDSI